MGNPGGRSLLGSQRRRWEYNIKINLKITGYKGVDYSSSLG